METTHTTHAPEKVNWLAEIRGLAIMLLAVLAFHSLGFKYFIFAIVFIVVFMDRQVVIITTVIIK